MDASGDCDRSRQKCRRPRHETPGVYAGSALSQSGRSNPVASGCGGIGPALARAPMDLSQCSRLALANLPTRHSRTGAAHSRRLNRRPAARRSNQMTAKTCIDPLPVSQSLARNRVVFMAILIETDYISQGTPVHVHVPCPDWLGAIVARCRGTLRGRVREWRSSPTSPPRIAY